MSSSPMPYPLRMPDKLRERLKEQARAHDRSLHAEIIGILQEAVNNEVRPAGNLNVDALAETIADRVVERLKDSS